MTIVGLETQRLLIRPPQVQDVDDIHGYMSDPEVMRYRACGVQTRKSVQEIVQNTVSRGREYLGFVGKVHQIVLKESGRVIGYCYLDIPWPDGYRDVLVNGRADFAEITYGLARQHWRKGYATEAARAVLTHGLACPDVGKVAAAVNPNNIPSIHVLQRCGFVFERKITWPRQGLVDFYVLSGAVACEAPAQQPR